MKVVILGSGRVGARLATMMDRNGHDVSIIDSNPDSFRRLPETFGGETVLGTGIDVDVLKSAGIEKADAFAAVTNGDNTNIMATQIAKEIFGVKKVLARIYDPGREGLYHELGLETVCPTTLISTTAYNLLTEDGDKAPAASDVTAQSIESALTAPAAPQPVGATAAITGAATGAVAGTATAQAPAPAGAQIGSVGSNGAQPQPPTGNAQDQSQKGQEAHRGLRGLFRP
ncbi:MAG: potassium channel family protein [Chloroflexia bacterium]